MTDFSKLTIGFIGYGNIAQAMMKGFLRSGAIRPEQFCACAKDWEKLCHNAQTVGMHPCRNAQEVAERSDVVIIAVKPYLVETVIAPIGELLRDKIVLSVVAGYLFDRYEKILPAGIRHLSTIPSVPSSVGEGITVCEEHHSLTAEECDLFVSLFSLIGLVEFVEGKHLNTACAITGCGPALAAMFLEALSDAAVLNGLPRAVSYRLAAQMIAGTGKLQLETKTHPGVIKDSVCSPGGTTIVGVTTLERKGFRSAVIDAIDAIAKL